MTNNGDRACHVFGIMAMGGLNPHWLSVCVSMSTGAGKTESTKFVMKYLTTVGAPSGFSVQHSSTVTVMDR